MNKTGTSRIYSSPTFIMNLISSMIGTISKNNNTVSALRWDLHLAQNKEVQFSYKKDQVLQLQF